MGQLGARIGEAARSVPTLIVVGLLLAGWVVVGTLDASLLTMHEEGGAAGSATGVTSPVQLELDAPVAVLEGWKHWNPTAGSVVYQSPGAVLTGYVIADIFLIALPLAILLLAALRRAYSAGITAGGQAEASARSAGRAWLATVTFFLFDALEDSALLSAYHLPDLRRFLLVVMTVASLLKWVALFLAVVSLIYALVVRAGASASADAGNAAATTQSVAVRPVLALRAPIAVVVLLVGLLLLLPGDVGRQVADVVLALPARMKELVAAVVGSVAVSVVLLLAGHATVRAYQDPPNPPTVPLDFRRWLRVGVAVFTIAFLGSLVGAYFGYAFWWILAPAFVLFALFLILSRPQEIRNVGVVAPEPQSPESVSGESVVRLLRTLVLVPPAALALVALRGATTMFVARQISWGLKLGGLTLVLAIVVGFLAILLRAEQFPEASSGQPRIWPWVVAFVTISVAGALWPSWLGRELGALGTIFLFSIVLIAGATVLVLRGDRDRARGVLALVGLKRVPYLAIVGILFVAASSLNRSGHYHDVEISEAQLDRQPMALRTAFDAWVERYAKNKGKRVPMLFLASSGGGIRSAYWTTLVLDCLARREVPDLPDCQESPDMAGHIFAVSGISGGSVGLTAWHRQQGLTHPVFENSQFLGPVIAAFAFRDAPNAVLHIDFPWADRGRVLEQSWERAAPWMSHNFAASTLGVHGPEFPLLFLHGATVDGGCRLTASVIDLVTPGPLGCLEVGAEAQLGRTRDLFDFTCTTGEPTPHDVRLSTAALLSARFPYVSPSGGLTSCEDGNRRTFVVDGGLIESSGAAPLAELWTILAPWIQQHNALGDRACIAPRLVLIDNGYVDPAAETPPRRPQELLAPLMALSSARAAATPAARQAAAIAFNTAFSSVAACAGPSTDGPIAHLEPRLHPGPLAPLGWSLSEWAEADLRNQLGSKTNGEELNKIRSWLPPAPS